MYNIMRIFVTVAVESSCESMCGQRAITERVGGTSKDDIGFCVRGLGAVNRGICGQKHKQNNCCPAQVFLIPLTQHISPFHLEFVLFLYEVSCACPLFNVRIWLGTIIERHIVNIICIAGFF